MNTRYIVFEGTEGVGKTTQTTKLVEHLKSLGYSVLQTKEPGTPLAPLTMKLREIMLSNEYDEQLTIPARELISQAIRSVHLEHVVKPALGNYDFVIQDRGILSGLAYGEACGNDIDFLETLSSRVSETLTDNFYFLYDNTIYLTGDVSKGLEVAKASKQEFEQGDAIEAKGNAFMEQVSRNMTGMSQSFSNVDIINVDGKGIDEVFSEILLVLDLPKS